MRLSEFKCFRNLINRNANFTTGEGGSKAVKIKHNNKLLSKERERPGRYGQLLWCEIGVSPRDGGAGGVEKHKIHGSHNKCKQQM